MIAYTIYLGKVCLSQRFCSNPSEKNCSNIPQHLADVNAHSNFKQIASLSYKSGANTFIYHNRTLCCSLCNRRDTPAWQLSSSLQMPKIEMTIGVSFVEFFYTNEKILNKYAMQGGLENMRI